MHRYFSSLYTSAFKPTTSYQLTILHIELALLLIGIPRKCYLRYVDWHGAIVIEWEDKSGSFISCFPSPVPILSVWVSGNSFVLLNEKPMDLCFIQTVWIKPSAAELRFHVCQRFSLLVGLGGHLWKGECSIPVPSTGCAELVSSCLRWEWVRH